MNEVKKEKETAPVFKIAGVYTAVILGAGFASGQELLLFFVDYKKEGFLGLMLAALLFALTGWAVMEICRGEKITDFNSFMVYLMGEQLGFLMEIIVAVFLFVLFSAMLASTGAVFVEAFHFPYAWGVAFMAALCFVIFLFDLDGLVEINAFLAPLLVVGGVFIGLYTFFNQTAPAFLQKTASLRNNWFSSAVLYASYNIVTAVSVLTSLHSLVHNKKTACLGGVLGGGCMGLLGLCISLPLFVHYESVRLFEIPLLQIVEHHGPAMEYFYILIFLAAVLTTALGNGFGLIQWLTSRLSGSAKSKLSPLKIKIRVTLLSTLAAYAGFSNFVGKIYPLFGYIGLFQIILILAAFVKHTFFTASRL